MKSLIVDGIEQEQEGFCFYFEKPNPGAIALLLKDLLEDLGRRYEVASLPLTSRKIAILGRGGKKFSATRRLVSEFDAAFPELVNRDVTAQLSHFRADGTFGVAQLGFIRSASGSPFGDARILASSVLATAHVVDWSNIEAVWARLADESECDWAVFGQPFANRIVGKCVIHIGDGLITSSLACEAVLSLTGMNPRIAFRSFVVGETRVALFRDPDQPEGDSEWLDVVALLAEQLMKIGQGVSPS